MSRLASSFVVILGLVLSLAACNEPDPAEEYAEAMQQMPPRLDKDLPAYLDEDAKEVVEDDLAGIPNIRVVPMENGLSRIRIDYGPNPLLNEHYIIPYLLNKVDGRLVAFSFSTYMDDPSPEETRDWTHEDWVGMEESWTGQFSFRLVEPGNGLLAGLLLDRIASNPPEYPQISLDYTGEATFIHLLEMEPRCLFRLEDLQDFSDDEWEMATSFHVTKQWKMMTWFDMQAHEIGYELISNGRRSKGKWPVEDFPVVYNHVSYDGDPAVPVVISEEEFRIGYDEQTRFRIGNVGSNILAYNFNRDMLIVIRDGKAHTLQLNQGISQLMGGEYIMKTNDVGFGEQGMYILARERDGVSILELPNEGLPLDGEIPQLQLLARLVTEDFYGGSINELPEGLLVQSGDGFFLVDREPMGRTIDADYLLAADAEVAK